MNKNSLLPEDKGPPTIPTLLAIVLSIVLVLLANGGPKGCWAAIAHGATPATVEDFDSVIQAEATLLERVLRCDESVGTMVELSAMQAVVEADAQHDEQELREAFRRARRSARLPDVLRFQTGARLDRDRENRLRLTQDFDGGGSMNRSSLEDRDTFQDDVYVDVRLSADWRLARTRWADDEIALRRERSALRASHAERQRELLQHWFALQHTQLSWCEAHENLETAEHPRVRITAAALEKLRLQLWQHLSALNTLTDGWFLEAAGSGDRSPKAQR